VHRKPFMNPLGTATALEPSADGDSGCHSIGTLDANHLFERRFVDWRVATQILVPQQMNAHPREPGNETKAEYHARDWGKGRDECA
jgi:hypothetical protein